MFETILIAVFAVLFYFVTGIWTVGLLPALGLAGALAGILAAALRKAPREGRALEKKAALCLAAALAVFLMARADAARARAGSEEILAAARVYAAENGRLPGALEELRPRYLKAIPRAKSVATNSKFFLRDGKLGYVGDPTTHIVQYDLVTGERAFVSHTK